MGLKNYGLVESIDELAGHCRRLLDSEQSFGFDIETGYHGADREKGSLHPETATVVGISFAGSTEWARYAPLAHDNGPNLDNRDAARLLWPVLNTGRGVAHNVKFELRHLSKWFREQLADDPDYGEQVRTTRGYFPVRSDTQVEVYLAADYPFLGLKPVTEAMFGHKMTELHELFPDLPKNKRKFLRFNVLDLTPQVVEYACEDSVWCLAIHNWYYKQLKDKLLYRTEMAVITECLCDMEDYGLRYDWPRMRAAATELEEFRDKFNGEIMAGLSEMAGQPIGINLGSPPQVSDVLYAKLGMKTSVYTTSTKDKPVEERKMSTGAIALAGLAKQYPVVKKILQWKEMSKLLGTYLQKYERVYNFAEDGHTHPNHLSAFVVTGRFAVSDPPYQQSPKKYHFDLQPARDAHQAHAEAHGPKCTCDEFAPPPGTCFQYNFRDSIIAPPEHYILGFDLSQAELRAIAGEANEQALLDAFATGQDVHTLTAALMLKIAVEDVTSDERAVGKTMNFALLYGMGVKSLADRLALPVEEAQALFDKYFSVYANIAAWSAAQVRHGKQYGYVTSRFGRRLPIWEYKSDKRWIQQKGDRACVNYPIQGCLPADTCVLTRGGWVPIGQFTDGDDVWTGAEWAPAIRLSMGVAPRLRLWLSDGRSFDCDDRHRLLVKHDPWPQWRLVTEAVGVPLCRDDNTDWGNPDDSTVEDWYWVGRHVGDGSLGARTDGYILWTMSFDGVKEADDIERFRRWLDTKPFKTSRSKLGYSYDDSILRSGRGKGVKFQGITPAAARWWQAHGIKLGARARTLRVPPQVFQLDRPRREAFCEGYLDADGNARHQGRETVWSKLTSASRAGLEDMLRLFQTIGRRGYIGRPVTLPGRAADGQDYVFYDLWLQRAPKELFIERIEQLPAEPMYTLSVDHPRHAFSSEGLISKNSATGDFMKIAMVRAKKALREAGLVDRVHLVMNVHDALEFYVHQSIPPQQVMEVLQPAVIFEVPGWPAMQADWHLAKRWGSPLEVNLVDGKLVVKGEKPVEIVPAIEEDDETGESYEVMPDVDLDVLRAAAGATAIAEQPAQQPVQQSAEKPLFEEPEARHLHVTLDTMPDEPVWRRFLDFLTAHPGPNPVTVHTPEGSVDLDLTTAVTPRNRSEIAVILGPVTVAYAAGDVDFDRIVQGLRL